MEDQVVVCQGLRINFRPFLSSPREKKRAGRYLQSAVPLTSSSSDKRKRMINDFSSGAAAGDHRHTEYKKRPRVVNGCKRSHWICEQFLLRLDIWTRDSKYSSDTYMVTFTVWIRKSLWGHSLPKHLKNWISLSCSPRLHLFDQKFSKICEILLPFKIAVFYEYIVKCNWLLWSKLNFQHN